MAKKTREQLEAMTVDDLKDLADKSSVDISAAHLKAEIVDVLAKDPKTSKDVGDAKEETTAVETPPDKPKTHHRPGETKEQALEADKADRKDARDKKIAAKKEKDAADKELEEDLLLTENWSKAERPDGLAVYTNRKPFFITSKSQKVGEVTANLTEAVQLESMRGS